MSDSLVPNTLRLTALQALIASDACGAVGVVSGENICGG
jgi:hypothetical protein